MRILKELLYLVILPFAIPIGFIVLYITALLPGGTDHSHKPANEIKDRRFNRQRHIMYQDELRKAALDNLGLEEKK